MSSFHTMVSPAPQAPYPHLALSGILAPMITFLCDLDGVVYRDRTPVPGAALALAAWRAAGHQILFATNNATHSRAEFVARLNAVGVPADESAIATSASALATYLRSLAAPPRSAYVVGAPALVAELHAVGISTVEDQEQPDCVVLGLDRQFTYQKLARAQEAVLGGATLYATNKDPQFPGSDRLWPGGGSIVAAVETACRQQAITIGKPGSLLYEILLAEKHADPARTIVVGDNLETDIPAAVALNMPSIFVLTGVSQRSDLTPDAPQPTLVVETLAELSTYDFELLFG